MNAELITKRTAHARRDIAGNYVAYIAVWAGEELLQTRYAKAVCPTYGKAKRAADKMLRFLDTNYPLLTQRA